MKKFIALAAAFVLLLSLFTGCKTASADDAPYHDAAETGAAETPPPKPTRPIVTDAYKAILGAWKYAMDFDKVFEAARSEIGPEEEALFDAMLMLYKGASLTIIMDFEEDHTYAVSIDEDSAKDAVTVMKDNMMEHLPELLVLFTGMSREEIDAKLAESDQTMEALIEQIDAEFNADAMLAQVPLTAEMGSYTFEEGKLVMTSEAQDAQTIYTVELSGSEMKVVGIDGVSDPESFGALLPMIFVRINGG